MNGGKLIQDVKGHCLEHTHSIINMNNNHEYEITSTHHQMQYPFDLDSKDFTPLYVSKFCSYNYQGDGIDPNKIIYEPEIVLYHKLNFPKCLAIQGHPEYMRHESPIVKEINNIINNLLNDKN